VSDSTRAQTPFGTVAPLAGRRRTHGRFTGPLTTRRPIERAVHAGTYELDLVRQTCTWSDELKALFGLARDADIRCATYMDRVHTEDYQTIAALRAVLMDGNPVREEHRITRDDGSERWVELNARPQRGTDGVVARISGTVADITARKRCELERDFLAGHDSLTGLPNRARFAEHVAVAIASAAVCGKLVAVVSIGLDDFKRVNATYGHAQGDRVIQRCAQRLRSCLRAGDVLARVGGAGFVVALAGLDAQSNATHAVQHMRAALARPMPIGEILMGMRASFGISCFPGDAQSPEQLVRNADLAMHHANAARAAKPAFFEPALRDASADRLRLEWELGDAIRFGDLTVHYQPVIDAATDGVRGVEALVRWQHRAQGLRGPDSFIRIAEETGMIGAIGEFVLLEATSAVAHLHRGGYPDLTLSVNVSPKQLGDDALGASIRAALLRSGMRADRLNLEITETVLISDPERAGRRLTELSRLGIRIALDDVGTGYSALTLLRQLPVHLLKVDRSFVGEITTSATCRAIASAIIALAHGIGMDAVAEGVETGEQRRILAELGCDAFQGWYFSPPLTAAALGDYLAGSSASSA
jgi:diguanylate cyclase (GGDEF)-like protein/PAS domain S-box-containing protein